MRVEDEAVTIERQSYLVAEELEQLIHLQCAVLESVALSQDYINILNQVCKLSEALLPKSVASIMLLDDKGLLNVLCAPSIPEEGIKYLNALKPGPGGGSCGNAVYRGEPQFISNTLTDPRWANLRELARDFNIGACWSLPIYVTGGKIVGTFALSSFVNREPTPFQHRLLEIATSIAGIVLQRWELDKQISYQAFHDELTGMANRWFLMNRLDCVLVEAQPAKKIVALVYLDLDRFKNINDSYGHGMGDKVLCEVAKRLNQVIDKSMTLVARIGGDEFLILLENIEDPEKIQDIAKLLLYQFETPFFIEDHIFYVMGSIGISLYPADGLEGKTLLSNADAAMYEAKRRGRNCYCFYSPKFTQQAHIKLTLEQDLRQAIKQGEFELYYQPQVNSKDLMIVGFEALIRWIHPEKGLISPDQFIPLAEEIGLINQLGEWVTQKACQQFKSWHDQSLSHLRLSINLSGRQLEPEQIKRLCQIVEESGINPDLVEFELTESYLMQHADKMTVLLQPIRNCGIHLAVDDFGQGYSSLAYLKRLPIDKLKIDQSLIRDIPIDENDQAICQGVIAMGHALGLKVIAEGVETEIHQNFLKLAGCDELQGFYFGKPQPAAAIEKLLFS